MRVLEVTKIFNKPVAIFVLATLGGFFLSQPVSAASDISVSNSGKVSFGKVSASSTGTLATGEDTLSIATDCEAGANVYATSVNGSSTGTSLINLATKEQDPSGASSASYTISTSSNTISSPSSLENNTWGLNVINNNTYYGLPEYSASGLPTVIYSGTNTELPIYYGAKVTSSLAPGTYTGEVLYTVTVNNSCLDYTVKFNKNADDATGDMSDQPILPTGGTLSENSFTYSGYTFLGWSLDPAGKTGTATNGIGTAEDVDFADKASFPGSDESILPGSETMLYAIWEKQTIYMQNWIGCAKMQQNEIVALTDSRDNQEYLVKKLPDGNCWMIQNLTLGSKGGVELTSSDTNMPNTSGGTAPDASNKYYLPPAGYQGAINTPATKTSQTAVDFNTSNDAQAKVAYIDKNSTNHNTGTPAPENTGYYNFYTVTLGYSYYGDTSITSGTSPRDICPKGWRLPWSSNSGTTFQGSAELYKLALIYNSNSSVWSNYIAPTSTGTTYPYTSDTTVFNNMTFGNSSSLDPTLNSNGAAGFTYIGRYEGQILKYVGQMGIYWSSSIYNNEEGYRLHFDTSSIKPQLDYNKFLGSAVRCISQYPNVTGYMQDFDSSDLAPGESTTLLDKRDNSAYTVKKFSDGSVWMTQNLRLGYDKGYALTSELTNIDNNVTYYIPKAGYQGPITNPLTATSTSTSAYFDTSNDNQAKVQYRTAGSSGDIDSSGVLFQDTGYYNFYTATLGFSHYQDSITSGTSTRDICPKGWRLPVYSNSTNAKYSWSSLDYIVNPNASSVGSYRRDATSINNFINNALFGYSGYFHNSRLSYIGVNGFWWSSTVFGTSGSGYSLSLDSNEYINPQNYNLKYNGIPVRCVAKEPYTINYDANGGTGEMAPSKGYIGGGTALSQNTFTKNNYYFAGWSTSPSATSPTYTDDVTVTGDLAPAGGSVTLYAVWFGTDRTMQNWPGCSTLENGATTSLMDLRDGSVYTIKRFAEDQCWMTQNLRLGHDKGYILTSELTNIDNNTTYYIPKAGYQGSITNSSTPTNTSNLASFYCSSVDSQAKTHYAIASQTGSTNPQGTSYYNFYTATLGFSYYQDNITSGTSTRDICPKGWKLPTGDTGSKSWYYFYKTLNSSSRSNLLSASGAALPYSGSYSSSSLNNVGSGGFWWSSTVANTITSYSLYMGSSDIYSQSNDYKCNGYAIRCVAK